MKARHFQGLVMAAAAATATVGFSGEAAAIDAIDKGTIIIAAERMTGFAVQFGGPDPEIGVGLITGGIPTFYNYPRIGGDYFIIDGLSIGGSLGVSHNSAGGGNTNWAISPRVGYAFALSDKIDFWPRGGIGWRGNDPGGDTAVITLEAQFLWNIFEHVGLEFGPTFDAGLAQGYGSELGGSVGLFIRF